MRQLFLLGVFIFLLPLTSVYAFKVTNLYQADLPIAAQTDDLKEQAIKDGFLQVLIKLSGDPEIEKNPLIKTSLQKADYYVQEFSYSPSTTTSSEYTIQIQYEMADVKRLLKKASISYWGDNRPLILVWLTVTNLENNAEIVSSDAPENNDIYTLVKQQSKKYGLPVIFPVMDVDDINQITPEAVTSMSVPVLKEAAKRYAPDALLIGNIEQKKHDINSRWLLVLADEQWNWTISDISSEMLITSLMNQVTQTLSKRYAATSIDIPEIWLKLEVTNITQRDDLKDLMKYLKEISIVKKIQLSEVSSDVVELSVLIRGSSTAFQQDAAMGQHLRLKSQDATGNELYYEWMH